jgi:hypothetical protein
VARRRSDRGFAMAIDALFRLEDEDAVFVIGRGPDGVPKGFPALRRLRGRAGPLALVMPRLRRRRTG